ncbi:MAG: hypothetical protein LUD17_10205 [Bacteroidales bacterium]|nr:hypothetical protein [Bacteroidales bacterium]
MTASWPYGSGINGWVEGGAQLGYTEADVVPCDFNGLESVRLVLLEKKI